VSALHLNPSQSGRYLIYPTGGIEGWVDLRCVHLSTNSQLAGWLAGNVKWGSGSYFRCTFLCVQTLFVPIIAKYYSNCKWHTLIYCIITVQQKCWNLSLHQKYFYVKLNSVLEHYTAARTLRSSDTNLLSAPRVCRCFGSRSFSVAAPTIWIPFILTFVIAVQ